MLDFPDNHNELLQKKYTTIQCLQMAYLEKYRTECFDKFKNAIQKILNKIFDINSNDIIITELIDLNYKAIQLCYENPLYKTLSDELLEKSFEIKKPLINTSSESILFKYNYMENESDAVNGKNRVIIIEYCNLIDDDDDTYSHT